MNTADEIIKTIEANQDKIAFVIGNGVNRYFGSGVLLSWEGLLKQVWMMNSSCGKAFSSVPSGISNTEFIDALEIELIRNRVDFNKRNEVDFNKIKKDIASIVGDWQPISGISTMVQKIESKQTPLLTTNFDLLFEFAFGMSERKLPLKGKRSTDFYPWNYYYGKKGMKLLSGPNNGFGIWHVHGMATHPRSIRIGLNDYMGLVERGRGIIQKNYLGNGFIPTNTWLDIVFSKSLFVFGLGLETDEVFLRWLLLQRAKYNEIHKVGLKGWYVTCIKYESISPGKRLFLESIGFEIIEVATANIVYEDIWG